MNKRVKIAKQLVKLAKELCSSGIMLENPHAPKHDNDNPPILNINIKESDILNSAFYKDIYDMLSEKAENWKTVTCNLKHYSNSFSQEIITEAEDYLESYIDNVIGEDMTDELEFFAYSCVKDVVDGLKKLAAGKTTYMDGNFADWSEYYDRQPMRNAQDVLEAASDAYHEALGTFGTEYNFITRLDNLFLSVLEEDMEDEDNPLSWEAQELIEKAYL